LEGVLLGTLTQVAHPENISAHKYEGLEQLYEALSLRLLTLKYRGLTNTYEGIE
jgi:hypothetical protein